MPSIQANPTGRIMEVMGYIVPILPSLPTAIAGGMAAFLLAFGLAFAALKTAAR